MSRDLTHKGVDKFVELSNDKRFRPFLFASGISVEHPDVQRMYFESIISYLQIMATNHAMGQDWFGLTDLASMSYEMYQTYLKSGGSGDLPYPDLNRFDT